MTHPAEAPDSAQGAGRRAPLSRALVLDRALAMADSEGLDALSVRRLAQELGVTPMALYWHFKRKDDLLEALADRVVQEVDLSVDRTLPWLDQVRRLIDSFLATLRSHPAACALLANRDFQGEHSLVALEVVLDVLRRAGFSPEDATQLTRHVLRSSYALVFGEPYASGPQNDQERAEAGRRMRFELESLPAERFPRLREAAVPLSSCPDPDAYYAYGVELMMAGILAMSPAASTQTIARR
jgi:AcrR family transcriptional regulator